MFELYLKLTIDQVVEQPTQSESSKADGRALSYPRGLRTYVRGRTRRSTYIVTSIHSGRALDVVDVTHCAMPRQVAPPRRSAVVVGSRSRNRQRKLANSPPLLMSDPMCLLPSANRRREKTRRKKKGGGVPFDSATTCRGSHPQDDAAEHGMGADFVDNAQSHKFSKLGSGAASARLYK